MTQTVTHQPIYGMGRFAKDTLTITLSGLFAERVAHEAERAAHHYMVSVSHEAVEHFTGSALELTITGERRCVQEFSNDLDLWILDISQPKPTPIKRASQKSSKAA